MVSVKRKETTACGYLGKDVTWPAAQNELKVCCNCFSMPKYQKKRKNVSLCLLFDILMIQTWLRRLFVETGKTDRER